MVRGLAYELWEQISPAERGELIIEFIDHDEPGLALINIAESVDVTLVAESMRNRISRLALRMSVTGNSRRVCKCLKAFGDLNPPAGWHKFVAAS